jgi:triosephosphate isomerase
MVVAHWGRDKAGRLAAEFIRDFAPRLGEARGLQIVVAPPSSGLPFAIEAARGSSISIAVQDITLESVETRVWPAPPQTLSRLGVTTAIVGHWERRRRAGEDDATISKKVRAALDQGLDPILCIGEDGGCGRQGLTKWWLLKQLKGAIDKVRPDDASRLAIAYQPRWAASVGNDLSPLMAQEAITFIRSCILALLGSRAADSVRLLYGGAVDSGNINALMRQPDIDGVLVGGRAGLQIDSLLRITQFDRAPRLRSDGS